MDDLPELPFEQVLSYLSLEDRLKARAVSRRWYHMINSFKVKSLCYSNRPSGFVWGKSHWISGAFAQNFIGSTRFATFFDTFGQTILSSLKHLRLCDLILSEEDRAAFARILNSFGKLEELDIIWSELNQQDVLNLNLPMLTSLQLENVNGIKKLTLEAPRLREVKILYCSELRVEIVHGESVEKLLVERLQYTEVKKLKNLKALYTGDDSIEGIDSTLLFSLQELKEVHTKQPRNVLELFTQKQRSGRADLKIYFCGLLLNDPHDPAMNALRDSKPDYLSREWLICLAKNPSRLADEIPFYRCLDYSDIEQVALGLEIEVLKRCTDLKGIRAFCQFRGIEALTPVQDIQRFLDLLKNCENIDVLWFEFHPCSGGQLQDLFNRLPDHCAVQKLFIDRPPSDLGFLFRLKHLIQLEVSSPVDTDTVRRALEELPVLCNFWFHYGEKTASIQVDHPKQFTVWVDNKHKTVSDLNAAIEFIFGPKS